MLKHYPTKRTEIVLLIPWDDICSALCFEFMKDRNYIFNFPTAHLSDNPDDSKAPREAAIKDANTKKLF